MSMQTRIRIGRQLLRRVLEVTTLLGIEAYSDILRSIYGHRGYPVYICLVTGFEGKAISFQTEITSGIIPLDSKVEPGVIIRRMCGDSALASHGVPLEDKDIPRVVLIADPVSLISVIGIKEYYKMIKDWSGDSTIMMNDKEMTVVKYSLSK